MRIVYAFGASLVLSLWLAAGPVVSPILAQPKDRCTPSANDPNSNVSPPSGTTTTRFAFCGRGFGKSETIMFWVTAPDGGTISEQSDSSNKYTTKSDNSGDASWVWAPPPWELPFGTYLMVAHGLSSAKERVIPFEIGAVGTDKVPSSETVIPPIGKAGTPFKFSARGYAAGEDIRFWIEVAGGSVVDDKNTQGFTHSFDNGRVVWVWDSPTNLANGTYRMVAEGIESGTVRAIPFKIGLPPPAPASDSGVEPKQGQPGTEFFFFARGFADEEKVQYTILAPDGKTAVNRGELIAVDTGSPVERVRVDWSWHSPQSAGLGTYTVVAEGMQSGVKHTFLFEIE